MTLQQIHDFKQWHLGHPHHHGMELGLCDLVLAAWVAGWMMLPAVALLHEWAWLPVSLILTLALPAYWAVRVALRLAAHRAAPSLSAPAPAGSAVRIQNL